MKISLVLFSLLIIGNAFSQTTSNDVSTEALTSPITVPIIEFQTIKNPLEYGNGSFPDDSLTYDEYLGENISGYMLAEGWREDTLNGGLNKTIYKDNPYLNDLRFQKESLATWYESFTCYRYKKGLRYTGAVADTFTVQFTPSKIAGTFNGKPYYEYQDVTVVFRGTCVNGMMEGRAVVAGFVPQFGMYNNLLIAECEFLNGEMVGTCKNYDLNSVDVYFENGNIRTSQKVYDYFEFKDSIKVEELTFEAGKVEPK
jgi:hypothetical protein